MHPGIGEAYSRWVRELINLPASVCVCVYKCVFVLSNNRHLVVMDRDYTDMRVCVTLVSKLLWIYIVFYVRNCVCVLGGVYVSISLRLLKYVLWRHETSRPGQAIVRQCNRAGRTTQIQVSQEDGTLFASADSQKHKIHKKFNKKYLLL